MRRLTSEMPRPSRLRLNEKVVTTSTSTASKPPFWLLAIDDAVSTLRRCSLNTLSSST